MIDEEYETFILPSDFENWCREGGWDGAKGFEETTSIRFEEIKGVPFTVIRNRVFLRSNTSPFKGS
jgi:hypothetical protein